MTFASGEFHFFKQITGKLIKQCLSFFTFDIVGLSVFNGVLDLVLATLENYKGGFCTLWGVILDVVEGAEITYQGILVFFLEFILKNCCWIHCFSFC